MNQRSDGPVAIYMPSLAGGGSQTNALRLAAWFLEDGHEVDLVVHDRSGHLIDRVPRGAQVVELTRSNEPWTRLHMLWSARDSIDLFARSMFRSRKQLDRLLYLPSLCRYLRRRRPVIVFSNLWQLAINLISARQIAAPRMPVVCIFRSAFFSQCAQTMSRSKRPRKWRRFLAYCQHVYSRADALVTVSNGLARDLRDIVGIDENRVRTIYNPSASPEVLEAAQHSIEHPWFGEGEPPVILAVGRLSAEKRFDLLIAAFAELRRRGSPARLVILGDGNERDVLLAQAKAAGVASALDLPGWADNPYAHMRRARLFVLCSQGEGLPTALIEAMFCGVPVVSHDCPHGPREILDGGRFGRLVPLNDASALAAAMWETLQEETDRQRLMDRARVFSPQPCAAAYRELFAALVGTGQDRR